MTVYAFIDSSSKLPPEIRDSIARQAHEGYRRDQSQEQARNPSLAPWDQLAETLKNSNRGQADHIFAKLSYLGFTVEPSPATATDFKFSDEEVESLSEIEHGRWNVERLMDGGVWAKKMSARSSAPILFPGKTCLIQSKNGIGRPCEKSLSFWRKWG